MKRTQTRHYDVAAQLRTPEEMATYLDAWLDEAPEDAAGIARALGNIARAKGMTQVAKEAGLSRESLYLALSDDRNPRFDTVLRVAMNPSKFAEFVAARELVQSGWATVDRAPDGGYTLTRTSTLTSAKKIINALDK